jgi:TIR domain
MKMRVFLSYASERLSVAEQIAFALRGRGHKVFFDQTDLPVAVNFDARIEEAIKQSDIMIFLISPESITPGSFTLTELRFARTKWNSTRNRVLPVLISPTTLAEIPPFLTSVQIMRPEGDVAAEVASGVDDLTPTEEPSRILPIAFCLGTISGLASNQFIAIPHWVGIYRVLNN